MNHQQSERETHRAQAGRDELVERVARAVGEDGTVEAPGRLRLLRRSSPTPKDHGAFPSGPKDRGASFLCQRGGRVTYWE